MKTPSAISDFYHAVCAGDAAAAKLAVSTEFGIQDGKPRLDWIKHELAEFTHRRQILGLESLIISADASPGIAGTTAFSILDADGRLLFEEALLLDNRGRISGNGRMFEIVTKLLFTEGLATRRAMAIRAPGAEVVAAIPDITGAEGIHLSPGMNYENDQFTTVSFEIAGDDLRGMHGSVFVKEFGSPGVKQAVYLRGVDNPRFVRMRKPVIHERFIDLTNLADGLPLWSVTAELVDGGFACVEHPKFDVLTYPKNVKTVFVTDALDNDWAWSATE